MSTEVRDIELLEEIRIFILLLSLSLDVVGTGTSLVEEDKLRCSCVLYREAFDIHRRGGQSSRFLIVVYLLYLAWVVDQELSCAVAFAHVDACREDEFVRLVDFSN